MSRSNFTPMGRFKEIIDRYGLKLMEVGTNHLRIFADNRKLFDYYPLRMKLFDYRQWKQLTYPSLIEGADKWETELDEIIKKTYGFTPIISRTMNNNNSKTIVWDNIPEWAIFSLEYGIDEELFLPDEDKEMITKFIVENFPNGYTMSVDWESYNEFDTNPAFGKACKTYKVTFCIL